MVNRQTPQWCEEMKKSLLAMAGGAYSPFIYQQF